MALDSHSLSELFGPLARGGQGYLFPLLCYVARQFSESPRAMQLVHLAVAAGAAFVLARWAPFSRLERVLLLLGYFTFYEYAVISRHYAVGMLLVWLACVFAKDRSSVIGFGVALGLACQTTVYAFIIAIAIGCGWILDRRTRRRELPPTPMRDAAIGTTLAIAGAIAGVVQLIPSAGTSFAMGWQLGWDAERALKVLRLAWRAFAPLPQFQVQFWNTNVLDISLALQSVAGVATLALAFALLIRNRVALATFSIGTIGLLAFAYTKYVGEMRHGGHFWILFVAALWLGGGVTARGMRRDWRSPALLVLLVAQCVAGAYASWIDLRTPFTNGPATAALLKDQGLDRLPLLGHREPPAASVALPLGKALYSPSRGVYAKYPDYGPKQREMGDPELRCIARAFARTEGSDIVLVINRELPAWPELDAAGARVGAIQETEDYHLYRLGLDRLADSDADAACTDGTR